MSIIDYTNINGGAIWIDPNYTPQQPWSGQGTTTYPNTGWSGTTIAIGSGGSGGIGTTIFPSTPPFELSDDTIEFLEMVLISLGISMTYDEFVSLTRDERKSLLRDIKIKQIIK